MRDAPHELIPAREAGLRGASRGPRAACLLATRRAEQIHGLPRGLLTAIALSESGLHAHALSIGGQPRFPSDLDEARQLLRGSRGSVMAGCVQVNARVHARGEDWPLDPFTAADWAGGMLARWARENDGSWTEALRRWHGASRGNTRALVCRIRAKLDVTNPGSDLFQSVACNERQAERLRNDAAAHLETAELQAGRRGTVSAAAGF
jgi:hypothetical protein